MLGIGLGSFLTGVQQGVGSYQTIQNAIGQQRVRGATRDAAAAATAAREGEVNAALAGGLQQPAAEGAAPSWNIGGQTYGTEAEARQAAERQAGSFYDHYMREGAPRVVQTMLENGQVDQADAFQKRLQDAQVQRGIRSWSGAARAAAMGDADGFRRHMVEAYNNEGYFRDGNTVTASRLLKGDDGSVQGMELTIRGRDGNERTQTFRGMADLYRTGINFMAPERALAFGMQELQQADRTRAQLAQEDRRFGRQVQMLGVQDAYAQRRENRGETRTLAREERTETRQMARDQRQNDAALERTVIGEQLRAARPPRTTPAREVTPEARARQIEAIRARLAAGDMTMQFGRLPMNEQMERARRVYEQSLSEAGRVGGEPAPQSGGGRPTVLR